jgi:putative acetyltransferase
VTTEDPGTPDVVALLERHLSFAHEVTPEGGVFALDLDALQRPSVTFFCARSDGRLLGIAALQELAADHGELKSMHTAAEARGRGVGRELLTHALEVARRRGYTRVSLETGNFAAFAPARTLYESVGFVSCAPFGSYVGSRTSACMTIELDKPRP